ncbi:ATP-binding protein [Micromonospora eburnea]|uniref:Histidine kinase-like ATPase domain n=1 Tax=Micromonospora eburnea TaxID=227316 RepID=A0A1C6VHK6_9ACTN|nr:ATP-binding protein [Micromonospora eburnea]SCL65370.1 Histidine kinase-like ATPase domain [Micromonospora eburnea]
MYTYKDRRRPVVTDGSPRVVRLTGVLDRAGVDRVRDALLARLWQRPGPVIVDLSALRAAGPEVRAVVDDVHRAVADWPAAGLLVIDPSGAVGPDGPVHPSDSAGPGAPVHPSLDRALAALANAPAAVLAADLPPVVTAAQQARALVTDGCGRWGVPALVDPARIAVTELVNNAVAHAGTSMTVRVAPRGSSLHLAVRDRCARPPAYAGLDPFTSVGGRGLLLVDTVARRWGSTPLPDGKVVWCVLHAEDETARLG